MENDRRCDGSRGLPFHLDGAQPWAGSDEGLPYRLCPVDGRCYDLCPWLHRIGVESYNAACQGEHEQAASDKAD